LKKNSHEGTPGITKDTLKDGIRSLPSNLLLFVSANLWFGVFVVVKKLHLLVVSQYLKVNVLP
jgi:hypothetical protein